MTKEFKVVIKDRLNIISETEIREAVESIEDVDVISVEVIEE